MSLNLSEIRSKMDCIKEKKKKGESKLKVKLDARAKLLDDNGYLAPQKEEPRGRPVPAKLSKEEYLNDSDLSMFPEIDNHIGFMPQLPPNSLTFKMLSDQLFLQDQYELEAVRTIFKWIIHRDLVAIKNLKFPATLNDDSVMGLFRDIVTGKKSLAHLFARIATQAGLHVKTISGFIKGRNWFPDHAFSEDKDPNHAFWNAVFIEGVWRFIDVRSALPYNAFESLRPKRIWEEFYFLPDPIKLIRTHYPDDKKWQIMLPAKTYTLKDFQAEPKVWPMYFSVAAHLPDNLTSRIQVPNTGHIEFEFSIPAAARKYEAYKFELLTRVGLKKMEDGIRLTTYVLHHTQGDKEMITVFCPKRGEYILEFYVMSMKYETNVYNLISIFQLNCSETVDTFNTPLKPPFPQICSHYGMSPFAGIQGITKQTPDAILQCDTEGEVRLTLFYKEDSSKEVEEVEGEEVEGGEKKAAEEKKKPSGGLDDDDEELPPKANRFLQFVQNLYGKFSDQEEPTPDRVLQCTCMKTDHNEVTFLIRVPSEGHFALILYYNTSPKQPEYVDFGHFLVTWKKPSNLRYLPEAFPHIKQGKLGAVQSNCDKLRVKLVGVFPAYSNSANVSWVSTDDSGEAMLCFEHETPLMFMSTKIDADVETTIECTPTHSFITVRAALLNQSNKSFLFKVFADKMGKVRILPQIYSFMFLVTKTETISPHLPKCPNFYWGGVLSRLDEFKAKVKKFSSNSDSYTQKKFNIKDNPVSHMTPCRLYKGGEDMLLELEHVGPFVIKPVLRLLTKTGTTRSYDQHCITSSSSLTNIIVRTRFPQIGFYVLALFCDNVGVSLAKQKLRPFYNCFIAAENPSSNISHFPKTFPMWGGTYHQMVRGLNEDFFEPGVRADYKIELNGFKKKDSGAIVESNFTEVVLIVDDDQLITAKPGPPGTYEWTYLTDWNAKKICVGVMETIADPNIGYALQYSLGGQVATAEDDEEDAF